MFNTETELIKILGWTQSSRLLYLINKRFTEGLSKSQIENEVVIKNKLFKPKAFTSYWNKMERIQDEIGFVKHSS